MTARHAAPPRHRAPVLGDDFHRPLPHGRRSAERFEPLPLDVLERLVARTSAAVTIGHHSALTTGDMDFDHVGRVSVVPARESGPNPAWTVTPTWEQVITGPLDPEDNFAFWAPVPEREERTS